jgi:type IV secretory pathway TrbL component
MSLNPFAHKTLKMYAVTFSIEKFVFTALCSYRVFQRAIFTNFLDPFEKWTFIFVHFYRAMPFLFWTFIESE